MGFEDMTIRQYVEELSSKKPVPGGGGVSALTAALAAGLSRMVCSLTMGKKKYAANERIILETATMLASITNDLYDCMYYDAEAFEPLSRAYSMPKDTDEQINEKMKVMEECLARASDPPMSICILICRMVPLIETVMEKGSTLAVSDAGCSAALAEAAFKAASLNVLINTGLMRDRDKADWINSELAGIEKMTLPPLQKIYEKVYSGLNRD
ncbi:MAG: cyclodeaminase/cyclohydrolase family protein [Lachnospiraceae bacterium]|nr:cyclodeaminase/cyclohydrolase family protein [Lachnospiraceae bacterium]